MEVGVVEAVQTPGRMWIAPDYWNLYFYEDGIRAKRCHRGWVILVAFVIGLFFYFIMCVIFGAIGYLCDKNRGEAKCRSMRNELPTEGDDLWAASWDGIKGPHAADSSQLCLGNVGLKYCLDVGGKSFYFEESKFGEIQAAIKQYRK